MTFAESAIKVTLKEVNALNLLKAHKTPPSSTARRPYLSISQRESLAKLSSNTLEKYFFSGECIHVPMLAEEETIIIQIYNFKERKLSSADIDSIAKRLPGRKREDVLNFLTDYQMDCVGAEYMLFKSDTIQNCPIQFSSLTATPKLEKQFSVMSLNSAVNAIAVRKKFGHDGRVFVGGCTVNAMEYNGPELLVVSHDLAQNKHTARLLDGHKTFIRRPNEFKRETVTCVVYDEATDTFITAGYDGRVLSWDAASTNLLAEIGAHGANINSVTTHRTDNIVAYGVNSGAVFISSKPTESKPDNHSECLFKKQTTANPDQNTVDWVTIPQYGDKTHMLYAGIGHLATAKGGVIESWDLNTGRMSSNSSAIGKGLSCMQVSPGGRLLAAGSGCIVENAKGDGIIRIFDLASAFNRGMSIATDMYDMEAVSFCPRTELLFATDSFTSNWAVYDLRFPNVPLFSNSHFMLRPGEVRENEVVAHCWLKGGEFLATGGHDETMKIWDCRRAFELVDQFTFKNGVAQIEQSYEDNVLIVGTDSGEVVWIAPPSYLDESHPRELESILTY